VAAGRTCTPLNKQGPRTGPTYPSPRKTVLALPGTGKHGGYTVAPGETLYRHRRGIKVPRLAGPGTRHRQAVGPRIPDAFQAGTVLAARGRAQAGALPAAPRGTAAAAAGRDAKAPGNGRPGRASQATRRARVRSPRRAKSPPRTACRAGGGRPASAAGVLARHAFRGRAAAAWPDARRRRPAGPAPFRCRQPGAGRRRGAAEEGGSFWRPRRLIVTYLAPATTWRLTSSPRGGGIPQAGTAGPPLGWYLPEETTRDLSRNLGVPSAWPLEVSRPGERHRQRGREPGRGPGKCPRARPCRTPPRGRARHGRAPDGPASRHARVFAAQAGTQSPGVVLGLPLVDRGREDSVQAGEEVRRRVEIQGTLRGFQCQACDGPMIARSRRTVRQQARAHVRGSSPSLPHKLTHQASMRSRFLHRRRPWPGRAAAPALRSAARTPRGARTQAGPG